MNRTVQISQLYNFSIAFHYLQRLILYSSFYNIIPGYVPTLCNYASIACLILKFVVEARREKFTFKWLIIVSTFFPFLWLGAVRANSNELIWLLIFVISAKNVEPESIAKTIYRVCGVGTLIIVFCALLKLIPNNYEIAIASSGKIVIRMYMGFIHCNVFGSFLSTIFMCHFFVRFNKINKLDYVYGLLLMCICAFVAYSRTNALVMLIAILSIFFYKKRKKGCLVATVVVMASVMVLSIFLCVNYNPSNTLMVAVDEMLTGRLSAAKAAYDEYGFSIMGQDFQTIFKTSTVAFGDTSKQQQVIDNAFMHMLVHYGILPSALLIWYYFSNVFWLFNNRRMDILFVVMLSFTQGIAEGTIYSTYNVALFILATVQYQRMSQRGNSIL